ncbi:MAG: hypothetical protein AABX75_02255 [Nanoarchaeota archaeon]
MVEYPILTQEQASAIAASIKGSYNGNGLPAEPDKYMHPQMLITIRTAGIERFMSGELKRLLIAHNEKPIANRDLVRLVLDLQAIAVSKLNNGHKLE